MSGPIRDAARSPVGRLARLTMSGVRDSSLAERQTSGISRIVLARAVSWLYEAADGW